MPHNKEIKLENKKNEILNTNCFTYKVEMIVQILAEDEKAAKEKLDSQGGYVSSRVVKLMDSVPLFNGKGKEK